LQSIALLPSKDPAKSHITLRLQAMNAPSSRLRYRLWLHNIGAEESTVSRVEIRLHNGKWKASLRTGREAQDVPLRPIARGFEIDLMRKELNGTLLLSAESYLRNSRLDATGTGALRLPVS
jgi:hypothetical protein